MIHIHQHLDIYVNGKKVTVPALVGIDTAGQFLTQLHTHDTTGILHVESPTKRSFRLGEFFGEWGVRLTSTCLGTLLRQPALVGQRREDDRRPGAARAASRIRRS